ncbi:hypothetical protein OC834_002539, partial [Tilletia horrida]
MSSAFDHQFSASTVVLDAHVYIGSGGKRLVPSNPPSTESMSRRPLSCQNHEPPPAEQMPIPILAAEEAALLLGPLCTAAEAGID